jgi:hypothetical protein
MFLSLSETQNLFESAFMHLGIRSHWSRGSSVSIVSGYELDELAIEARSPAEARDFSSNLCAQISSGVHPASCTMGTVSSFPRGKVRPRHDTDHLPR